VWTRSPSCGVCPRLVATISSPLSPLSGTSGTLGAPETAIATRAYMPGKQCSVIIRYNNLDSMVRIAHASTKRMACHCFR